MESMGVRLTRFDMVMLDYGGDFKRDVVEAVQRYLRLCIVFLSFVPFNILLVQFSAIYKVQGTRMKLPAWSVNVTSGGTGTHKTVSCYRALILNDIQ